MEQKLQRGFFEEAYEFLWFAIKIVLIYVLWRTLKHFGEQHPNFLWGAWSMMYDALGNSLAAICSHLLNLMGYEHFHEGRLIRIPGTIGIFFADLCLGVAPMFLFSGVIVAYGNNHLAKLWFIPTGVFVIYCVNVFRLLALILIQYHKPEYFSFAHEYVYAVVTYSLIILMVMFWMNRLSHKNHNG